MQSPKERLIELPLECQQFSDSPFYDVGECPNSKCRGSNLDATGENCGENRNNCCGIANATFVKLQCDGYVLDLYVVERCGCVECEAPSIDVVVFAYDVINGSALEGVELVHKSKLLGFTDANGQYFVSLPVETTRISITARANGTQYATTTSALDFPADAEGTYHMLLKMAQKSDPVVLQAGAKNTVLIEFSKNSSNNENRSQVLGQFEVENFFTPSGQEYRVSTVQIVKGLDSLKQKKNDGNCF